VQPLRRSLGRELQEECIVSAGARKKAAAQVDRFEILSCDEDVSRRIEGHGATLVIVPDHVPSDH